VDVHLARDVWLVEVECPECGGEGRCEYEVAVIDWEHGGYLKGERMTCERCQGDGVIEVEDEEQCVNS